MLYYVTSLRYDFGTEEKKISSLPPQIALATTGTDSEWSPPCLGVPPRSEATVNCTTKNWEGING